MTNKFFQLKIEITIWSVGQCRLVYTSGANRWLLLCVSDNSTKSSSTPHFPYLELASKTYVTTPPGHLKPAPLTKSSGLCWSKTVSRKSRSPSKKVSSAVKRGKTRLRSRYCHPMVAAQTELALSVWVWVWLWVWSHIWIWHRPWNTQVTCIHYTNSWTNNWKALPKTW